MAEPVNPQPAQTQALRLARKTQSLDILYEVATSLSQPGSLEQLLEGFLEAFTELVDARAASVRLATGDGHTRLVASRGLAPEVLELAWMLGCVTGLLIASSSNARPSGTRPA